MFNIIRYDDLANYDFGWLNARYHFSFGRYHDPARMGFKNLRVINDDIVKVGEGFGEHPHDNMEIITYVRKGAISHRDSTGNEGRTAAGDVQVMSAGSGLTHSEFNQEAEDTTLYQIWIMPTQRNVKPRWDARSFPETPVNDALPLLVSGNEADTDHGALTIHADAVIYGGRLEKGTQITQPLGRPAYILISDGDVEINGELLHKGDGAAVENVETLDITAKTGAEILVIGLAA